MDNELYKQAETIIFDYTGSFKWSQVSKLRWTSAEVQELIVKALEKNHDKSHKKPKK